MEFKVDLSAIRQIAIRLNMNARDLELMEADIVCLAKRIPDVPTTSICLMRLLQRLSRELTSLIEEQIRPSGLSEPEFRALVTLFSEPEGAAHPGDLCSRSLQSPANMSRISDTLLARGFITRDSSNEDRRRMVLRLTEEGDQLVRLLLSSVSKPLQGLFRAISDAEQGHLASQLKHIGIQLGQIAVPHISKKSE